jgi:hypothetical protein
MLGLGLESFLLMASAAASPPQPAAPRTVCDIRLSQWCIAFFDGTVEMRNSPHGREWFLQDRIYMDKGPLIILEDKACRASGSLIEPHLVSSGTINHKRSRFMRYQLNGAGCYLTFQWPAGSMDNYIYQITVLSSVLVGSSSEDMRTLPSQ